MNIKRFFVFRLLKKLLEKTRGGYDFDKSNPLGGGGERVDFTYSDKLSIAKLDVYQINHYRRYEFACTIINKNTVCGDFACGTGYGTVMLAQKAQKTIGADINEKVISTIVKRYKDIDNVQFIHADLLNLSFNSFFDAIVSFETIEHFKEHDILDLIKIYNKSLKPGGKLIISTPYLQIRDEAAINLGHHLTFNIDEKMINKWLSGLGFSPLFFKYQNYETHTIEDNLEKKDFIICVAQKLNDINA